MITFLIGAAVGVLFTVSIIFIMIVEGAYKVLNRQEWKEHVVQERAFMSRVEALTAENAKLQVALSAGQMTDDGKKVAAMTIEALGGVIASKQPVR